MSDLSEYKKRRMEEALQLNLEWQSALIQLMKGRQYDELSAEEQQQYRQIDIGYNKRIENIFEDIYPILRE